MNLPDIGSGLTAPYVSNNPSWRGTPSLNIDDTLSWLRGAHSFSFGGSVYLGSAYEFAQQRMPTINFGIEDPDPASALFTTANFAGASTGQVGAAPRTCSRC